MFSGGPIDDKWLLDPRWSLPLGFGVAHYFDDDFAPVCGAKKVPYFYIGDWKACKRCTAKVGEPTMRDREASRSPDIEALMTQVQSD